MELLKSGLKTVLGTQSSGSVQQNGSYDQGAETIERLIDRLQSSTLMGDRRDAIRALRSLSKKYRVEVGAQGMDSILHTLETDKMDPEIVAFSLETLLNITSPTLLDEELSADPNVGKQFTEIFIKKTENVLLLLSLLEEYDFKIRFPLIRLMTNLLTNCPKDIQEVLLVSPMGVSKLIDLLSDSREVIRNEALLLLIALTKNNSSIQKIIAFENGFDKILGIIHEEGYADGGPIVEDSLHFFLNLLRNNTSNQTFFREGSYIKHLVKFFTLPDDGDAGWATQKVANVYHMLQIVRTLVSPLNPSHVTSACQRTMKACGILECLCNLLMSSGVPAETLTEAIVTVGELMRGNLENQQYFSGVMAPSEPPRPALVIILMTLVNDRQPLNLRCAVVYCVQCFLYKNEKGQEGIIGALLPATDAVGTVTAGQLLCSGLFNKDISSNWFSSITLSHALLDNLTQKESLLKVQLVTKPNTSPITLMNHILNTLQMNVKTEVKLGFLQFLAVWLESCPNGVAQFLSNSQAISFLTAQITASTDASDESKETIVHGLCAFIMGLCLLFNSNAVEAYTKENLFQLITNRIGIETLTAGLNKISKSEYYLHSLKHPQLIAKHTKDLVFDNNFSLLFKKYETLILLQLTNFSTPITLPTAAYSSDNMLTNRANQSPNEVVNRYKEVIRGQDQTIAAYKNEVENFKKICEEYKFRCEELGSENTLLRNQLALAQAQNHASQMRQISEDKHNLIVGQKDQRIEELELQLLKVEQKYNLMSVTGSGVGPTTTSPVQEELVTKLEEENKLLVEEVEKARKDQEELLELLTDQDNQIRNYKFQLRGFGVNIPSDDEE